MKREIIPASKEHESEFRQTYQLKEEFRGNPEYESVYEYAATTKLYGDELSYVGAVIERRANKDTGADCWSLRVATTGRG